MGCIPSTDCFSRPEDTLQQFQTNVFAVINMCKALLPFFRSQGSGTLASIGSIGARLKNPYLGLYHGLKAALRSKWKAMNHGGLPVTDTVLGMHLALDAEVRPLGIKTFLIEPGRFQTALLKAGGNVKTPTDNLIPQYDRLRKAAAERTAKISGHQIGNPELGAERIYEVLTVTAMAQGRDVPLELLLGSDYNVTREILSEEIQAVEEWKNVSCLTDFVVGISA